MEEDAAWQGPTKMLYYNLLKIKAKQSLSLYYFKPPVPKMLICNLTHHSRHSTVAHDSEMPETLETSVLRNNTVMVRSRVADNGKIIESDTSYTSVGYIICFVQQLKYGTFLFIYLGKTAIKKLRIHCDSSRSLFCYYIQRVPCDVSAVYGRGLFLMHCQVLQIIDHKYFKTILYQFQLAIIVLNAMVEQICSFHTGFYNFTNYMRPMSIYKYAWQSIGLSTGQIAVGSYD